MRPGQKQMIMVNGPIKTSVASSFSSTVNQHSKIKRA